MIFFKYTEKLPDIKAATGHATVVALALGLGVRGPARSASTWRCSLLSREVLTTTRCSVGWHTMDTESGLKMG